ncbi:hypothetical protein HK104_000929 [Borealophlyctis nickersoniae]|nr:hypothetical protein HK104_000929 [Borealophlyctis nickersoniae]
MPVCTEDSTPSSNKKSNRVIGVFQDVTRQRRAEMESQHKSTWVRQVGHEIRNPLAATWTMVNLLLEMDISPEIRDMLETIRTSNDTLLSLINSILGKLFFTMRNPLVGWSGVSKFNPISFGEQPPTDLSKLEAGEMNLESIPFDLRAQIEDSLDLMAPQAHKKRLRVGGLVEEDVPRLLKGDALRLRQIVINLFTNSVKFTKTGSVVVHVQLDDSASPAPAETSEGEERVSLKFMVVDTGIGIAADNIPKLFREFAQAESNTSRMYGGTGLGLSIVRRLVHMMHGEVGITSVPNKGSTFWFTATFSLPNIDDLERGSLSELVAPPSLSLSSSWIIILSEWDGMRNIVANALKSIGGTVTQSADIIGKVEELKIKSEHPAAVPDLIVLDVWDEKYASLIPDLAEFVPLVIVAPREKRDTLKELFVPGKVTMVPDPVKMRRIQEDAVALVRVTKEGVPAAGHYAPPMSLARAKKEVPMNMQKDEPVFKVMLVEDNPINQKAVSKLLQNILGSPPIVANDGQMCLDLLEETYKDPAVGLPDLIFMDVCMPVMDG